MDGHDSPYVVYQQRILLLIRLRVHPSSVVPIERNYPPLAQALNRHPSTSTAVIKPSLSDTYPDILIWMHLLNPRERSTSHFRFFDLYPEIRNRIYHLLAAGTERALLPEHSDRRAVSHYQESLWPKLFDKQTVTNKEFRALQAMSQNQIGCPTWSHDYSILLVSKRLYREASAIFYEKVTLIVRSFSIPMFEPLHHWPHVRTRLGFVRHLTLDSRTAFELLWHGSHGIGLTPEQRGNDGYFLYFEVCLRLRESFPHVERIDACSTSFVLGPSRNIFRMLMNQQTRLSARLCAFERFPRLHEIRYMHDRGGEIYLRLENNTWKLAYTKWGLQSNTPWKAIPISARRWSVCNLNRRLHSPLCE